MILKNVRSQSGDDAVEHLLRVISGLDSIVLGETQILGQMRDAFFLAKKQVLLEQYLIIYSNRRLLLLNAHIVKLILQIMLSVFLMLPLN